MNGSAVRVLILSCEEGEGHASAARTLERELRTQRGVHVIVQDALLGGLGRVIPLFSRDVYRLQLRWAAWTYGLEYFVFTRLAPTRWLARFGLALLGARPLLRMIEEHSPNVVVSTHPSVTNVLGYLRRTGRLDAPTVATVTDFGVHPLWASRGIDLHLVMHEVCAATVDRIAGRGRVEIAAPIVAPEFRTRKSRAEARQALGLPSQGFVVVVSGGGWGVGDVASAVAAALRVTDATVVCLTGRNERLQARLEDNFAAEPRVRVLPFTNLISELLAAADALVDATVGVTCLEALEAGCRIVVFGMPPGHSRENARALVSLGLAERANNQEELTRLLGVQQRQFDRPMLEEARSAAALVLAARPRAAPLPGRRRQLAIGLTAVVATLAFAGWTFASPAPYPLLARALSLQGLPALRAGSSEALVVIAVSPNRAAAFAHALEVNNVHGTLALVQAPGPPASAEIRAAGVDLIPELTPPRPTQLLEFRRDLHRLAKDLGVARRRFYYLPVGSGLTLADYLAARGAGGLPLGDLVWTSGDVRLNGRRLDSGDVLAVSADQPSAEPRAVALRVAALLHQRHLRGVSLSELRAVPARNSSTAGARTSALAPATIRTSEKTIAASLPGSDGQPSRARAGARATGTSVFRTKTIGAT